jgi:membrane-associated protease RseP (regulator of RpoE activity)
MKKIPVLHLVLFVAAFLTTLVAGAVARGANFIDDPIQVLQGLPFACTLMLILLVHEMSHYLASRSHHVKATLPYFIPWPIFPGTFGAFIKMKSPIDTRRALIDIGASGPIAGFVVSVTASAIGLSMSTVVHLHDAGGFIIIGDSLLFSGLSHMILGATPEQADIMLHPVAFAGWIGLFVTSLNLIPIGQLDGGHIIYAFIGRRQKVLSMILVAALAVMGYFLWVGWAFWAVLMFLLKIEHPPVIYWEHTLDRQRRLVGYISFIIFIITFVPVPFRVGM